MFLHHVTIKFLTYKCLLRENFSRKALGCGKKSSFFSLLSLFSSLRIMRAICLLPLLATTFPLLAQNTDKSTAEIENTAQEKIVQEQDKKTALQEEKNFAKTEQNALLPPAFGQITPEPANAVDTASSYDIPAECKNLRRVRVIDELLYQMYSNLDSQCLFEISAEKLEEIWEIPVLDYTSTPVYFHGKEYDDLIDRVNGMSKDEKYFYLKKMYLHYDKVGKKYPYYSLEYSELFLHYYGLGGSLGLAKFPYYLPSPEHYANDNDINKILLENLSRGMKNKEKSDYQENSFYFWIGKNSDLQLPILIVQTTNTNSPSNARLFQYKKNVLEYLKRSY